MDGPRRRLLEVWAAAWLAILAVQVCPPVLLDAAVIDDFSGPAKKFAPGGGGMEHSQANLVDGQLVWSSDYPGPSIPSQPFAQWDNVYWPLSLPSATLDRRTLEVRMDLVQASGDDVFLLLGVALDMVGYGVFLDQDEVALVKFTSGNGLFYWTHASVTNRNVTVALRVTRLTSTIWLSTKIVERVSGRVLYESPTFSDGPDRDFEAITPPPKGMTVWGPDPGGAVLTFNVAYAGIFQWATNEPPPLEVLLDNLEYDLYDAPQLKVSDLALLSWSEDTAEEQIVLGAASVDGPWSPWPEPIYKRFGQFAMAAPTTNTDHYYKLAPGTQFVDNFDPLTQPFAVRYPWEPFFLNSADAPRFTFTITNGAFQIQTQAQPVNGQVAIFTPGGGAILGDFFASVDILNWLSSSQDSALGIAGRIQGDPSGLTNAYLGSLRLNPTGMPDTARLYFFDGANDIPGASGLFGVIPGAKYRLQFSAAGEQLTLQLLRLPEGTLSAQDTLQVSRFHQGRVGLWVNTRGSSSYARTVDNFFVTGTKP